MANAKAEGKEEVSVQQFGDLVTGCVAYASSIAFLTFVLGGLGTNFSLRYVRPMVVTRDLRFLTSLISGVSLSLWAAKRARISCEQGIDDKYTVLRLSY